MISPPPSDQSPNLLKFIAQQQARIEVLENEIIRLKKLNPKPSIKPNTKPPDDNDPGGSPTSSGGNTRAEDPQDNDSYSRKSDYVNWNKGRFTSPERLMNVIVHANHEDHEGHKALKWFSRKKRKIGYLLEAFKN